MSALNLARLILLAAIWGASFLFMRIGVPVFGPGKLILLRVGLAAVFLLALALYWHKPAHWRANGRHYVFMGVFNSGLPFLLYAFAAQTLNASLLAIINAAAPIFGALVTRFWLGTPLSRGAAMGLSLGFAGVALIVGSEAGTRSDGAALAAGAALLAPLCYALATSYAKKHASHIPSFDQAHGSMWASSLCVLPLALLIPARSVPQAGDWLAVTALALICTGWAYLIYFRLVSEIGPARTLTVTFLIPVFGVLWGALFLGEHISLTMLAGGVIVLAGTALANGWRSKA
ncbi:DMT family transporter [Uliginosibacterium sp. TH139]|uniref:DMT family transporter n=1 Tax=Uliginosibacterium sp. TH139 TaxID=2067453 RepID=UPI000C7B7A4A|nr:DMT family transporter [Uliginosibacterium sp. TH139]PLK49241.1 EamA family transporter [Uliginosibacterium sp. TH139]